MTQTPLTLEDFANIYEVHHRKEEIMNCIKCNGLVISERLPFKHSLKEHDTMWKCINCGLRMFEQVKHEGDQTLTR